MANSVTHTITLEQLLPQQLLSPLCASLPVKNIQLDSRRVEAGDVFVALPAWDKNSVAGYEFIEQAIAAGAAAIIFDSPIESVEVKAVPFIGVQNLAAKLSSIAAIFYHQPSKNTPVIAITGTNGKTTVSQLVAQLFALAGKNTGIVGTLGAGVWNAHADSPALVKTGYTTPDAITSQKVLRQLCDDGAELLAIEVSSHALEQDRIAAVNIDCAVFTNLSHDHLDYHGDMQSYGAAKAKLFQFETLRTAIINVDDTFGRDLLLIASKHCEALSYSLTDSSADIYANDIECSTTGIRANIDSPWGQGELRSSLLGRFNLSNLLAVIGVACQQGMSFQTVLAMLPRLELVSGRMQSIVVADDQDVAVVVDFAHTPDALENSLQALRDLSSKNLICVFGCGGDRDPSKRAPMGKVAAANADIVVLTSDNPRSENPELIIAAIAVGMENAKAVHLQSDRACAIALAISQACGGDTILIAGKGHEDEQIFATMTERFSDVDEAKKALLNRMAIKNSECAGSQL